MSINYHNNHTYASWSVYLASTIAAIRIYIHLAYAEAALANGQSTTRLVLNADGARVYWGRGQFYTAKLAHLRFRRIFLAVFQIGACA